MPPSMPKSISCWANLEPVVAKTKSQFMATMLPPPKAIPLTAPMMVFSVPVISRASRLIKDEYCRKSKGPIRDICSMSAPAMNALSPALSSIMTRISSRWSRVSKARQNSFSTSKSRALSLSGRFNVTLAIAAVSSESIRCLN